MKKLLCFLLMLFARPACATIVYSENFSSYSVGTPLTNTPTPDYLDTGSSFTGGTIWQTISHFTNKAAYCNAASWAHAMYNGATYGYTDLKVRCDATGGRTNIFARVTSLGAGNSIPTDGYQIQYVSPTFYLQKGGYATNLGTANYTPANTANFVLELLCNGTSISAYVDGTLIIGPITDSAYSSGHIGIGTYAATVYFTDISVDGGNLPTPTPTSTPTPSPTPTATATASPTPQCEFRGALTPVGSNFQGRGVVMYSSVTFTAAETVSGAYVFGGPGYGQEAAAIYSDFRGRPWLLLGSSRVSVSVPGWNTVTFSAPIAVSVGVRYWLAVQVNAGATVQYSVYGTDQWAYCAWAVWVSPAKVQNIAGTFSIYAQACHY